MKSQEERNVKLRAVSSNDIEEVYRKGYITAGDRNKLVHEKARATIGGLLEEEGFFKAIFSRTIQHIQDGWENLKESITREPTMEVGTEAYNIGLALWGQIQILTSGFNAIGEITGQVAENMSLRAGASPGLARVINIATDVGTGFVPIGLVAKSGVKGVRAIGEAKKTKQSVKAAESVVKTVKQGLEIEGVTPKLTKKAIEGVKESDIPRIVQRIEEKGIHASTVEKPHGLYTTSSDVVSPHVDLGGAISKLETNPNANILRIDESVSTSKDIIMRKGAINAGAGVSAAFQLLGREKFLHLKGLSKTQLIDEAKKIDPTVDWLKYFDNQEIMEGIGETLARKAGYDAIWDASKIDQQFNEFVGLTQLAFKSKSVQDTFMDNLIKFRKEIDVLSETQTHEKTAELAAKLNLSLDDLKHVVPGKALDEKQMYAYLKALEPPVDELVSLARKSIEDGTEASLNVFMKHASEFFTIAPIFRGAEITAGRSVEILKETPPMKNIVEMLIGWDPDAIAKGDIQGAIKTFAEDIVAMADDQEKIQSFAVQSHSGWQRMKEKWWPMAREAYINILLARPITQTRNFIGNSVAATNAVLERLTGAAFSIDKEAGLVGKEGLYLIKGMMAAMGDGLKAFGNSYKQFGPDEISKLDFIPREIPGVIGSIIRSPGDTMRGMDNFFKTILRRGSYYASAMRDGVHRGLEKRELADFISRRVNHPTEKMLSEAEDFATSNTFQNELGKLGKTAQNLQTGPLALYFPFMKTPINLAKYVWNRTPGLQLISKQLYDDILVGGIKADLAIGRLTMSNLTASFLFELAKEGFITGSGPVDPALRRAWMAKNQPYSIKTKDGWIPISNAEPGSTIFGMVADFTQVMNQLDDPSVEQGAMAISFTLMRDMADKTYWLTLSDIVDMSSATFHGHEPSQKAIEVITSPITTVLTGGPLIASVAKAVDPIRRETRGFINGLISRVPGYSKVLPPMRDGYGDFILPPQAIGGEWIGIASPLTYRHDEKDRIKLEGAKLQVNIPKFPWTIGGRTRDDFDIRAPFPEDRLGIELSPQQRDRWQQMYKNMLRHPKYGIEKQLLDNPIYLKQTRAAQREMFMDLLSDYRSTSREALQIEDLELGKKILRSEASQLGPMLQEEDRNMAEGQLKETLDLFDTLNPEQRQNLLRWGIVEEEESK